MPRPHAFIGTNEIGFVAATDVTFTPFDLPV